MMPRQRAGSGRRPRYRHMLESLEGRLAPALATAEVSVRFQDTVVDPPAVTGPLVAETQATTGPTLGRTVGQARAGVLGPVRAFSQVGGIAGNPGVTRRSAEAHSTATQTSNYIVQGLPAGTTVALDATLVVRGFIETKNFTGPSAGLETWVRARLNLTDSAGTERVEGFGILNNGTLMTSGQFSTSDFTPGPGSTPLTPHEDLDLTRTLPGVFTVTAGEVFSVEAFLETNGFVGGPFELFTTADFFNGNRGFTFTLDAPGGTVVPINDADLSLVRSGYQGPVLVGSSVSYTLTVTNHGPNVASNVTLTDSLLDGLSLVSATPSQGSYRGDAHTLVYALGTLAPGQSATVIVVVRPRQVDTFTGSASVTASETDPDPANNAYSRTTEVRPAYANMAVTLDDEQDPVRVDSSVPFVITVTNHGPETATGVTLVQNVPFGTFSFSSISGVVDLDGARWTAELPDLAPNTSVTVRTRFFVAPGPSNVVESRVDVSAFELDVTPENRADTETTTFVNAPRPPYEYTLISGGGVWQSPSINSSGRVAYKKSAGTVSRTPELQSGTESLFLGGRPTVIADGSSQFEDFGLFQTINDAGTVAFWGIDFTNPLGNGIFIGSGGQVTTIADESGPWRQFGASPSISNGGNSNSSGNSPLVVFPAFYDTGVQGIFLADGGGPPLELLNDSGEFDDFYWANVNDRGQVVFYATLDSGVQGLFFWDGGVVTTLADSSGPFATFNRRPSLNDNGVVIFAATMDNGDTGIFIAENGTIRTFVDSSGPYSSFIDGFVSNPVINNAGRVAFRATLDTGLTGIFTGPDPELDRVVVRGPTSFGLMVDMAIDWQGMNDSGQIAFWAEMINGGSLIVRAEPDPDRDHIPSYIEDGAPGGDGNGDGRPDSSQANVVSFPNAVDGRYLTLYTPRGTLSGARSDPAPLPPPTDGATFPVGTITFSVEGLTAGETVELEVIAPGDLTSYTWYKYLGVPGWYPFDFDGTTGAIAVLDTIRGNPVTRFILALADGNPRSDLDGQTDGRILDPGGPARLPPRLPVAAGDSYTVAEDRALSVPAPGVLRNDRDPAARLLSAQLVHGPAHGKLSLHRDGSFRYVPAANFHGVDRFTYRATTGNASSTETVVTITVTPVLDARIDLQPGRRYNRIDLRAQGLLPVVIRSTALARGGEIADARALDPRTIRFGDPRIARRVAPVMHILIDLDRDGHLDLVAYFSLPVIRRVGALRASSTQAIVTGFARTRGGRRPFEGKDAFHVAPARTSPPPAPHNGSYRPAHPDFISGVGSSESNKTSCAFLCRIVPSIVQSRA